MTEMAQAPDSVEDLDILIVYNIYCITYGIL